MPRRRIPNVSVPRRPDRRRSGGNATDAQRPARRARGQVEAIVERRVRAFELRRSGATYREIARQLGADLHTVHSDIQAELLAIRVQTIEEARDLRALELERLDAMTVGLWPGIQKGNAANVGAGVRISERRAKLLGLDAPTTSKTEVTGSLSVGAETRLKDEVEDLQRWLTYEELRELGEKSESLFADARALVEARRAPVLVGVSQSPAARVADLPGEPTEPTPVPPVNDERDALGAETDPPHPVTR